MRHPVAERSGRVGAGGPLSRLAAALALVLAAVSWAASTAEAHEVQPAVMNLTLEDGRALVEVEAAVEPFVAGIDLDGLADTDQSDRSGENDRLRRLPPGEMAAAFEAAWREIAADLGLRAGGEAAPLELRGIEVPEVGDPRLARISTFRAEAALPDGAVPVVVEWAPRLGGVAIRQMGRGQEGYTGYLPQGGESDPIPRAGGSGQGFGAALASYVPVGFTHIVPLGLDHILFVLGLFFLSARLGPLLWQVTAFTLAHTLTLALAALGIVSVPAAVVEPLIAASIVYVGVENVLARGMSRWRPLVVTGFGLLHGLGFAGVLTEYGLGRDQFAAKLVGFNIGVELGQLAVIAAAALLVAAALVHDGRAGGERGKAGALLILALVAAPGAMAAVSGLAPGPVPVIAGAALLLGLSAAALAAEGTVRYREAVANPASILVALAGAYWFVERVFL